MANERKLCPECTEGDPAETVVCPPSHQSSEQGAPELLPCPFAHHFDQLRLAQSNPEPYISDEADGEFAVVCRVCGGSTRRYYRRDMAIRAWNTRTRSDICASLVEVFKETAFHFHMAHRHDITISPFESCEHRICTAARTALAQAREKNVNTTGTEL